MYTNIDWFDKDDTTKSVFSAKEHSRSNHREQFDTSRVPKRAVLFCMGKAMGIIKENFETETIIPMLPGFITRSEVVTIKGYPNVCFLHGGYGAPQTADVVETLHALGVEEFMLFGMIGGIAPEIQIGDVTFPDRILAEDGVSFHYGEAKEFIANNCPTIYEDMWNYFKDNGHNCQHSDTVTSVAVFRQTFNKEEFWRQKGCVGVEMEGAGFLATCQFLNIPHYVVFFVSDKHPLHEGDKWEWRTEKFTAIQTKFVCDAVKYFLK